MTRGGTKNDRVSPSKGFLSAVPKISVSFEDKIFEATPNSSKRISSL